MKRRTFLAAGSAALGAGLAGAGRAHENFVLPEEYLPRRVTIRDDIAPGEIHVFPDYFKLYWTLPGAEAISYTCGVGREGLYESGEFTVGAKKEWPSWTPTPGMIEREPEKYKQYEDGMPGGPDNPLGARALYLFTPERGDTYLRIHGTGQPWTVGTAVSNGCARLTNEHIVMLYNDVPMDTRVILYPKGTG
ncbi:L,D-transpeptidase [Profundibacterium mesophilum]|uniref:Isoquinoline 1-oxidoreductase n=1 Tax=Profundibacterium mesophilum KAUST100406-0324 TaxID=1037889 RepID=A0A921TFL5_9RHOB|nr:L,D-transpeptidase [Profundibacterium mesophilum]KAF0676559.1 isoquinoline 1-oxidoreductase [Profundibacterium mesophilum KAUST100406-0324]